MTVRFFEPQLGHLRTPCGTNDSPCPACSWSTGALERMGAILLEGTEDVSVDHCHFTRLDSNAIMLSGYNRRAAITDNQFSWLGQNAIASWGRTVDNDGTNGDQPRLSTITGNWIHEIGHIQKQSSFYFQATSAQTTIKNNVVFNIPRAGINFNVSLQLRAGRCSPMLASLPFTRGGVGLMMSCSVSSQSCCRGRVGRLRRWKHHRE